MAKNLLMLHFVLLICLNVFTYGQISSTKSPCYNPLGNILEDYIQREISRRIREANAEVFERIRTVEERLARGIIYKINFLFLLTLVDLKADSILDGI